MKGLAHAALALVALTSLSGAEPRHGMSLFGDLALPADFTHMPDIDPDAPKGGKIAFLPPSWNYNQNHQTFNTLNGYVTRGDAPPRIGLTLDTLMAANPAEPDAVYGLLAESAEVLDDGNVRFRLREGARFHDGTPVTAEDVAWSIETLKEKGHPSLRTVLDELEGVDVEDERTLVARFTGEQSPDLKLTVAAGLPIFSKAYFEDRDFEASTLQPVLGSGPYRVGDFEQGRYIEYERVPDYWGADLPVNVGRNNFDTVRIEFYRDRTTGFEAFKKGDLNFREEFTSKTWGTEYDFPAVEDGRVVKTRVPGEALPDFQGWYANMRREKFADPRVRQAIGLLFDFEWVNESLFFNSYARTQSFFENSPFVAEGLPSEEELALLEPLRDQIPEEAFGEPYVYPPSDGSGRDRRRLREAAQLLKAAGWERGPDGVLVKDGERLSVEFLINAPIFERVLGKMKEAMRAVGIEATIRLVDPAQYQARLTGFDFDITGMRFRMSAAPLAGLKDPLMSTSADVEGSRNYAGIKDPAVDALVNAALKAETREEHAVALRALDRVLRANRYHIPQWVSQDHRVAYWDVFGMPEKKPDYDFSPETTWWSKEAE